MTTRYVGVGGDDGNSGLTWALRKLTLNGVEDTPVVAGDTVYVGPGTYRELLTCDWAGSAGLPITYIGDYSGANTDGVGGIVRITGSDDDVTATRANAIVAAAGKHYRTFRGFVLDMGTSHTVSATACTNWTIAQCVVTCAGSNLAAIYCAGAGQASWLIQNCYVWGRQEGILFTHTVAVDNAGHVVENCILEVASGSSYAALYILRVGGGTVRNCLFRNCYNCIRVSTLTAGQIVTVNNCLFYGGPGTALIATTLGELVEDYNDIYAVTARSNVDTGANSSSAPLFFDARWFFEAVAGTKLLSFFDVASYWALLNTAGTSPTTTDLRGTSVQGAQREWGPLEYDTAVLAKCGASGGTVNHLTGKVGG